MTNEELKKKIIEVIDCLWIDYPPESDEVADALIAAGLKFDTVVSHTATFDRAQQERINKLERRLEVLDFLYDIKEKIAQMACDMCLSGGINNKDFQDEWSEFRRRLGLEEVKITEITSTRLYDYLRSKAEKQYVREHRRREE